MSGGLHHAHQIALRYTHFVEVRSALACTQREICIVMTLPLGPTCCFDPTIA